MQEDTASVTLSRGGFPGKTEVLTTDGPIAVSGLEVGDRVYALNASTEVLKPKRVTSIDRFDYEGPLVQAKARRIDWLLHPDQRVPYRTKAIDRIRFQRAGDLDEIGMYKLVNEWRSPSRPALESVDVTEFVDDFQACVEVDCHGHTFRAALPDECVPLDRNGFTGYHFDGDTFKRYQETLESLGTDVRIRDKKGDRRRPYRFDGEDFIRFIGWYVTEGSITEMANSDMWRAEAHPFSGGWKRQHSTVSSGAGRVLTGPGFKYEAESMGGVRIGKPGVGWVSPSAKREPARTCHPTLGDGPMARPVAARGNTTAEAHTSRCGLP